MSTAPTRFRLPPIVAATIVAALQTAVIGFMVEGRASILKNGTEVRLKTVPVDPRDLLRGDYVILSYGISSIPGSLVTGPLPTESGRVTLSVRLKPGTDGLSEPVEASFAGLAPEAGTVILKSLPFDYYFSGEAKAPDTLFVSYGIERYYVPEGEGKVLEDARNQEELEVDIRVSDGGTPQVARLVLRGEPIYAEPLYRGPEQAGCCRIFPLITRKPVL